MNYLIELKFYKSNNWTYQKTICYLNLNKFEYAKIDETNDFYFVFINEPNINFEDK